MASVSTTTRPKRANEIHGEHYYFVSNTQFDEFVEEGAFLEYATVFQHRYGTSRNDVTKMLQKGFDVLFDIDWQGARSIRQQEMHAVSFFLIPPSIAELQRRLSTRGQDSTRSVKFRMSHALDELAHYDEFDYVIENDVLNTTCDLIHTCIARIRRGEHFSIPSVQSTLDSLLDRC